MTIKEKVGFVSSIFMDGVKCQAEEKWVWGLAATIGLSQGLKYKGNIKLGVIGGVATLATITVTNGIRNVVSSADSIKRVFKEV